MNEEQVERLLERLECIGSELNQLAGAVNSLERAVGGVCFAITQQTETLNQQGESLKDSITDLTLHVASQSVSIPANYGQPHEAIPPGD